MRASRSNRAERPKPRIRFVDVLRAPDFAALYAAELQSIAGDQLARVALSVMVFERTGSSPATAATYAATLLPALFGGWALGRLGDRVDRRAVMIGTDLLRAGCFAAMAVPATPLPAVIGLVILAVFLGPAFSASQVSFLAARLPTQRFAVATALRLTGSQAAQVSGFAIGGVLVEALGPRRALLVNAATFLASAVMIGIALCLRSRGRTGRARLAVDGGRNRAGGTVAPSAQDAAFRGLWGEPYLRSLIALGLLIGFFVVPEGLAVPFGSSLGASSTEVGFLLAAGALGGALGSVVLVRYVAPEHRGAVAQWMAIGCGIPLIVTAVAQNLVVLFVCWCASGFLAAYVVQVMTTVVQSIPDARRAHLVGIVGATLLATQGVGLIAFGAATRLVSPGMAIGSAGLMGTLGATALVIGPLQRTAWNSRTPSHAVVVQA